MFQIIQRDVTQNNNKLLKFKENDLRIKIATNLRIVVILTLTKP